MTTATINKLPCACTRCGKSRDVKPTTRALARVPTGWKRRPEGVICDGCWTKAYVLRAITVNVASPAEGVDWKDVWEICGKAWTMTRVAANWATRQLALRDNIVPGAKLKPMPPIYLYGIAKEQGVLQELPGQIRQSLLRSAEARYRAMRKEIWLGKVSLPSFGRLPWPVGDDGWSLEFEDEQRPVVSVLLPGGRVKLRLQGGPMHRRTTEVLRRIESGEVIATELSLIDSESHGQTHRHTDQQTAAGGGKQVHHTIKVKIVAWFPREARETSGTLHVRTDKEAFLVALDPQGERLWTLHADLLRRWIGEHATWLRNISDDNKAEQRKPRKRRRRLQHHRDVKTRKHHNRVDTFCWQAAAMVAKWAMRRKVATVEFKRDETCFQSFPWFKFIEKLKHELNVIGVEFVET